LSKENNNSAQHSDVMGRTSSHPIRLYFLFLTRAIGTGFFAIISPNVVLGLTGQVTITLAFLFLSLRMRTSEKFKKYWEVFFAFFISGTVVLLRSVAIGLAIIYGSASTLSGQEVIGVSDFVLTVTVILVLTKVSGKNWHRFISRREIFVSVSL